jgi:DNA invertase Pin-like site-specific DNA recombinase
MNAASYCRVSSKDQQIHGSSLEDQQSKNIEYASNNNLNIVKNISEVKSAHKADLCEINNNEFKNISNIIISDVSRFSRNVESGLKILQSLTKQNKIIHFIREQLIIDRDVILNKNKSKYKQLVKHLQESENESIRIGERIKSGKQNKRKRGEYDGGSLPFGLKLLKINTVDKDGNEKIIKKYAIDKEQINIIKFIDIGRNPPYTTKQINKALGVLLNEHNFDPIELYDEHENISQKNTEKLNNSEIANLLNEYSVLYKGKTFTGAIISRIKSEEQIKSYVKNNYIDDLIAQFDDITISSPSSSKPKKIKRNNPNEDIDQEDIHDNLFMNDLQDYREFQMFRRLRRNNLDDL